MEEAQLLFLGHDNLTRPNLSSHREQTANTDAAFLILFNLIDLFQTKTADFTPDTE